MLFRDTMALLFQWGYFVLRFQWGKTKLFGLQSTADK